MICSRRKKSDLSQSGRLACEARPSDSIDRQSPYGMPFWRAYVANTAVMMAFALLFRYADFVTLVGGNELHLGWIVGVGMVGSLLMRLFLGSGIDRYGPRLIWLCSLVVFSSTCFAHLLVTSCHGPAIYILRIVFCSAIAGIFGSIMTFVSGRAPIERMAEMIGMLGTSGFLGIVLGTQLGDLLCGTQTIQRWQVDRMFVVAGMLGMLALMFAWGATRDQPRPVPRKRPPLAWLLKKYHPGSVLLVGVALGMAVGLPSTFLRTYAAELDIPRIGLFFAVYAPAAIITRLATRRLPERLGLHRMILLGLGLMIVGQLLLLVVDSEWMFVVPGIGYGMGHAILFPATVAAGSRAFPNRYRGLGMTVMLATVDGGQLIGAPLAGGIIHFASSLGLPGYPTMFVSISALLGLVGISYALLARRRVSSQQKTGPHDHSSRSDRSVLVGAGSDE